MLAQHCACNCWSGQTDQACIGHLLADCAQGMQLLDLLEQRDTLPLLACGLHASLSVSTTGTTVACQDACLHACSHARHLAEQSAEDGCIQGSIQSAPRDSQTQFELDGGKLSLAQQHTVQVRSGAPCCLTW